MKKLLTIIILFLFLGCEKEPLRGSHERTKIDIVGKGGKQFKALSIHCLLDAINPTADTGGEWTVLSEPPSSNIGVLVGDNPCVDFISCGSYQFRYVVESLTCTGCNDTATINVNYIGAITANIVCN